MSFTLEIIFKNALLLFLIFFLISCLNNENEIVVNSDLSGTIKTSFVIDKNLKPIFPIDFLVSPTQQQIESIEKSNLHLVSYLCIDKIKIKCEYNFRFENLENISLYKADDKIATIVRNDDSITIKVKYMPDKNIKDIASYLYKSGIVKEILKNYSADFVLKLPNKIIYATHGVEVKDNVATYKITLDKILSEDNPIFLEVTY